jgi:hypothetical protein
MSILSKAIYRVNVISISVSFFTEVEKTIINPQIAKVILGKK